MTERWETVAWAPSYAVSDQGRVKRILPDWQGKYLGRFLKPAVHRRGYRAVKLCLDDGSRRTVKVHRLVCEAFHGEPPSSRHHDAHIDGDVANNSADNLYWATAKENAADRERHGRTWRGPRQGEWATGDEHWTRKHPERVPKGAAHPRRRGVGSYPRGADMPAAKLNDEQALAIIRAPQYHGVGRDLAEQFGISMGLVSAIRKGRVWKHLQDMPER